MKTFLWCFLWVGCLLGISSCSIFDEDEETRKAVPPQSDSSTLPWNQMQSFEQNSIFGPMNQRR